MPLLQRRQRRGTVASASRVQLDNPTEKRLRNPEWQERAWAYYGLVGEVHYAGQFYSRGLQQLRVYPEYLNDEGEWVEAKPGDAEKPVPNADKALTVWDRVQDPNGGRDALFGNYGRCRFIAGESYLVVSVAADGTEVWEMLSTDELVKSGDHWRRRLAPGIEVNVSDMPEDQLEALPGSAIVYRMWKAHPRFSLLADAPMLGVLDICEELVMLTRAVRARARSRLTGAGLFVYSNEVDFEDEIAADGQQEEDDRNPFERTLQKAMMTAIQNEGDASAFVPVMAGVPSDAVQNFGKLIPFGSASDSYPEISLRDEAVTRLARGLDMPPEILLGLADSNHWTSWQIDRQTWKAHLQPVAQEMVSDFTGVYFRPALKEAGVTDVNRWRLWYDPSKVVNNPDQTKDAQACHDRFALSDLALLVACGFDAEDAPDEDELAARVERLATAKGRGAAVTGIEGTSGVDSGDTVQAPPAAQPDGSNASGALEGAFALAVERCRELAGSRIRTRLQRKPDAELEALIDGVANRTVALTLGQAHLTRLRLTPRDLVKGGSETLAGWMSDQGYPKDWIEQTCRDVEEEAARSLWRPRVRAI